MCHSNHIPCCEGLDHVHSTPLLIVSRCNDDSDDGIDDDDDDSNSEDVDDSNSDDERDVMIYR